MLEMALIENIQRENLNAIEIALSYQRLMSECNLKQDELGERVGKNRTTVTNYLRLLKLPPDIQIAVRDNLLSMGHARAIINVENADQQLYIFKRTLPKNFPFERWKTWYGLSRWKNRHQSRAESHCRTRPQGNRTITVKTILTLWHSCCSKERWKKR
jgi:hypothetical protein